MRHVYLTCAPARFAGRRGGGPRRRQSHAEKRQLKAELPPIGRCQVAGDVPPLVRELRMRSVVARESKFPRAKRAGKSGRAWLERQCAARSIRARLQDSRKERKKKRQAT